MAEAHWLVSDLVNQLESDPWRAENPFSDDMAKCHAVLFDSANSRQDKIEALSDWLAENQPCLFGKMEAKQRRLPFCLLTDNDLEHSDQDIRRKIAQERTDWKRQALNGNSHGFLIVIVSKRVAFARPDGQDGILHQLASRLCELYVGDGPSDEILHDDVLLEIKSSEMTEIRKWKVGVNYFSAQGDRRWWRSHRFPGGIAFSMNSVGHMARTRTESSITRDPSLFERFPDVPRERLVYFALLTAMKTIGAPSDESTRGTWLGAHGDFPENSATPPYQERPKHFGEWASFSENRYRGYYHTDQTIPSDYFDPGLWRKEDLKVRDDLYFTYLHSKADTDYLGMALGEMIEMADQQSTGNNTARSQS